MKLTIILSISFIVIFAAQIILSQEKVDTAAMKKGKSIHEVEWEKHKEMRSEKNSQLEWTLQQTDPNPFNLQKKIEYHLPIKSRITLEVYDKWGKKIRTLVDEEMLAGNHQVVWDCHNDDSQLVPRGIYLAMFYAEPENSSNTYRKRMKIFVLR